jgi:hypothetical protein
MSTLHYRHYLNVILTPPPEGPGRCVGGNHGRRHVGFQFRQLPRADARS